MSEKYAVMADAPWLASSTPRPRPSCSTAALLIAYGMAPAPLIYANTELTTTICPRLLITEFERGRHRVDDSSHVDGHDTAHLVGRECAECAATSEDACVGDRNIDARELLQRQAHRFLDRREVGDVAVHRQTMAPRESRRNRLRPG